jgi:predicted amidohydrolase YtcJ
MWTEEAAYSLFMEAERGRLAPGAAADPVVLSADPLVTDPDRVTNRSADHCRGEIVFERPRRDDRGYGPGLACT